MVAFIDIFGNVENNDKAAKHGVELGNLKKKLICWLSSWIEGSMKNDFCDLQIKEGAKSLWVDA